MLMKLIKDLPGPPPPSENSECNLLFLLTVGITSDPEKVQKKLMHSLGHPWDVSSHCGKTQSLSKTKAFVKSKEVQR